MELKKSGWILTDSGLKSIENNTSNPVKILLNKDLREVGAGCSELHKGKLENVDYELIVLQIVKIRNVSAPKANESSKTAPKLLKLGLTDGQNNYSAIEMEPTALSIETPPGTKISLKVKQLKIANGQLLLTPKNMDILGGHVEALVSKWEISRSLANQMKANRTGGAPPFIPFGHKIQAQNVTNDKGFKSLQSKQKEHEENSEFNAQRQDAIAEATKAGTRKTFGGGNKTLVDTNVQKIIDKGYTEEQATTALKFARNNVEKALSNLKRREERQQQRASSNDYESRDSTERKDKRGGDREGRGDRGKNASDPPLAKPSTGVSLFDFLENKIPESTTAKHSSSYSSYAHNERFENNISSSFRKFDKDSSNKSHQWSQQQQYSSGEQKSSQNYNKHSSYNSRNDYHGNESSSYRDYKGSNNYQRGDRDRDRERDREGKQSYYQQSSHGSSSNNNNNYAGKERSAGGYSKSSMSSNQKPSQSSHNNNNNSSHYNNDASSSSYNNNNNNNKGKYGQKSDYQGGSRDQNSNSSTRKDYNNSYSSGNNSYQSKPRSSEGYQDRESNKPQRNVVESMEKMSLKGNHQQHYKGGESKYSSQSNYPTAGFQSKEANEQAKTALKTKNIPSQAPNNIQNNHNNNHNNNWQQQQQQPAAIQTPPSHVPIQVPVISQATMKTAPPPPFSNQGVVQTPPTHHQMHTMAPQPFVQHPVMAMPQTAVFTYPAPPIIMQSVPMQQAPTGLQLKINDHCLAKYWEDGKYYNAKITGVSESTFVVLFTEYGNAEEVRRTDCVPIIVPQCPTPPQPTYLPSAAAAPPPPQAHIGTYRVSAQKMQQQPQHSYHTQPQSMSYKGGPKQRRN